MQIVSESGRGRVSILVLILVVVGSCRGSGPAYGVQQDCEVLSTRIVPAPNGVDEVRIVEQVCGGGLKSTTLTDFYSFSFYLAATRDRQIQDPFLVIDGGSGLPQYLDVRWPSPEVIEVVLVRGAIITVQRPSVRGVEIRIQFAEEQDGY